MKRAISFLLTAAMVIGLSACGGSGSAAGSQDAESKWPATNVQYYVPAASGGGTDLVARVFTSYLQDKTGKGMVVTNQPEGSGSVAASTVSNAKADGTSLMFAHTGALISSATGSIPLSMVDDFTTIAYIPTVTNYCVVVNAKSDFQTMEDLVEEAKANPGKVTFGVALGASTHMMASMIAKDAGVEFNYVDAGSDTEKVSALVGGHIQASLVNPNNAKQFQDSGDIRVLSIIGSTEDRAEAFPDVPNLKELGYENCSYSVDFVVWGPKNMDPKDVQKIHDMISEAASDATVLEQCQNMNFPLRPCLSVEEGQAALKATDEQYRATLKDIGIIS